MAFSLRSLVPMSVEKRGTNVSMYTYTTTDASTTIDTSGYFNDASTILLVGDVIHVFVTSSSIPQYSGYHVVLSNSAGVVDVSDIQKVITTVPNDTD